MREGIIRTLERKMSPDKFKSEKQDFERAESECDDSDSGADPKSSRRTPIKTQTFDQEMQNL